MTIVNPLASANLVVQSALPSGRPEERQHDLRLEQIVRATVVEGGLDRAMLEMNHQRFRITAEQELYTGQQLELQVLTTRPKLTFKVLSQPIASRLGALLPLLNTPFDWHGLLQNLAPVAEGQAGTQRQVLAQLAELLRPVADLPAFELSGLIVTLGQLRRSEPLFAVRNGSHLAAAFDRVLQALTQRVERLELPQQLKVMALQIRQQPELNQVFQRIEQGRIEQLLQRIDQPQEPLTSHQALRLATELRQILTKRSQELPRPLNQVRQELGRLLSPLAAREFELDPTLLGHLKPLAEELQVAYAEKSAWPRELEHVVGRMIATLQPLLAEPQILVRSEQLGLLSQLFGLNLEAELLRGRTRQALQGLKVALLGERQQLGPEGEEALHRLELFQVCRARLADQNQLFIPLPLPFLEEGFLLVDEDGGQEEQKEDAGMQRLSLHLRLSALGNLRIDLLSEPSGMLLRIACEDQERASFLQELGGQLQGRLQGIKIRSVSFTLGARSPARELVERLVQHSKGMLDARV